MKMVLNFTTNDLINGKNTKVNANVIGLNPENASLLGLTTQEPTKKMPNDFWNTLSYVLDSDAGYYEGVVVADDLPEEVRDTIRVKLAKCGMSLYTVSDLS